MATISRTGITAGGTITPTHITNIIDALDGTGVGITVVATGSFSGSLVGTATTATTATSASFAPKVATFPYTGSAIVSGSLQVTGSVDILGNVTISGSANTITLAGDTLNLNTPKLDGSVTAQKTLIVNFADIALSSAAGKFVVPLYAATSPVGGTLYWDDANNLLYIYSATHANWTSVELNIS